MACTLPKPTALSYCAVTCKRASLARFVLLVQRLLGWNLAAVLIHVMNIERSIRMQEERTRSADAGELVHMFDRRIRKPTRMEVHCGLAFHFHPARAAHHHQLFVGRMKVPGRATAFFVPFTSRTEGPLDGSPR